MKRLLILPILALIGAAAFCTGMFSTAHEESNIVNLPTASAPAVTAGSSDEYLYSDTAIPTTTQTPAETTQAPTTPGVTEFTHNGFLSGTVATPDTDDVPETETVVTTTKPATTTKPVTTTTKPATTTKKPTTTTKPATTTKAPEQSNTPSTGVPGQAQLVADIAKGEIGVKESKYNNVKYNTWFFGYEVRDRYSSSNLYPWCVVFVSWCGNEAGLGTDIIPWMRSSGAMQTFYKEQGRYTKYSSSYTPKVGDIIFIDWDGKRGKVDHVGIVISVENGIVTTVEGNYSDKVSCNTYALNSKYIAGYATPDYK